MALQYHLKAEGACLIFYRKNCLEHFILWYNVTRMEIGELWRWAASYTYDCKIGKHFQDDMSFLFYPSLYKWMNYYLNQVLARQVMKPSYSQHLYDCSITACNNDNHLWKIGLKTKGVKPASIVCGIWISTCYVNAYCDTAFSYIWPGTLL